MLSIWQSPCDAFVIISKYFAIFILKSHAHCACFENRNLVNCLCAISFRSASSSRQSQGHCCSWFFRHSSSGHRNICIIIHSPSWLPRVFPCFIVNTQQMLTMLCCKYIRLPHTLLFIRKWKMVCVFRKELTRSDYGLQLAVKCSTELNSGEHNITNFVAKYTLDREAEKKQIEFTSSHWRSPNLLPVKRTSELVPSSIFIWKTKKYSWNDTIKLN